MESIFSGLMQWVELNPHWAGLIVFVVSALESLLVVGLFVPGSLVMFGFGAMIAAGSMELAPTLVLAAAGALFGDAVSYFIGRFYHQRLRVIWPFRRYPDMIARGVDFCHKHGGKSILLARFVGPVRPLVPAVAGMLDMPTARFLAVDTVAAALWAPVYILPGVLFGASLGIAAEIAGRLAVLLIMLVALLWFSWWLVQRLARMVQHHALAVQVSILDRSRRYRWIHPLAAALLDPNHPEARGMTVLTVMLLVASWVFLITPQHLTTTGLFSNLDLYLFNSLQELRSPLGDRLLVITTQLGSSWVLYSFTALMSAWLLWKRRWRAAVHWLVAVTCVGLLTHAMKHYTAVERPPLLDTATMSYAFPSAHASVSVAVFGFLAVLIARELRSNWHWIPYSVAVFLIVPIGFSRLYLGAHWLSDVLAGWSLGLAWVALMGIAYRHHPAPAISATLLTPLALAALLLIASFYSVGNLDRDLAFYRPKATTPVTLEKADWLADSWRSVDAYRDDLKGRQDQPLDIQWLGKRDDLVAHLQNQGWRMPGKTDLASMMDLFNSRAKLEDLPVLPQVHRGETQHLLMLRDVADEPRLLVLRLWPLGYHAPDDPATRLWAGTVSYLYIEDRFKLFRFLRTDADFNGPLRRFAADTTGLAQHWMKRHHDPQPEPLLHWDGSVLLLHRED